MDVMEVQLDRATVEEFLKPPAVSWIFILHFTFFKVVQKDCLVYIKSGIPLGNISREY